MLFWRRSQEESPSKFLLTKSYLHRPRSTFSPAHKSGSERLIGESSGSAKFWPLLLSYSVPQKNALKALLMVHRGDILLDQFFQFFGRRKLGASNLDVIVRVQIHNGSIFNINPLEALKLKRRC